MDLKGHTNSHCIIANETQIILHFFQGQISANLPEIRADLLLALFNTGMCLLTVSFFNVLLCWFPAGQGLKNLMLVLFFKVR